MLPISPYQMLFDPSRYTFLNGRLKGIKMSRRDTYFMRLEIMRFLDEAARNELVTPTLKRSISQNTPQD